MNQCCVSNCKNASGDTSGVSFFGFPVQDTKRAFWMQKLQQKDFSPTASTQICSDHFTSDCIELIDGKATLKPHAMPTIFEFFKNQQSLKSSGISKCEVVGCCNSYDDTSIEETEPSKTPPLYFRFPVNEGLRQKWSKFTGRPSFKPKDTSRICGRHFDESRFARQKGGKVILKSMSVPTLFSEYAEQSEEEAAPAEETVAEEYEPEEQEEEEKEEQSVENNKTDSNDNCQYILLSGNEQYILQHSNDQVEGEQQLFYVVNDNEDIEIQVGQQEQQQQEVTEVQEETETTKVITIEQSDVTKPAVITEQSVVSRVNIPVVSGVSKAAQSTPLKKKQTSLQLTQPGLDLFCSDCKKVCPGQTWDQHVTEAHPKGVEVFARQNQEAMAARSTPCEYCTFRCNSKFFLKKHMNKTHPNLVPEEDKPFSCRYCKFECFKRGLLYKHINGVHVKDPEVMKIICACGKCTEKTAKGCRDVSIKIVLATQNKKEMIILCQEVTCENPALTSHSEFRRHLQRVHNHTFEETQMRFNSVKEFLDWKVCYEKHTKASYISPDSEHVLQQGKWKWNTYNCDHHKELEGVECTASLVALSNTETGVVKVNAVTSHYRHNDPILPIRTLKLPPKSVDDQAEDLFPVTVGGRTMTYTPKVTNLPTIPPDDNDFLDDTPMDLNDSDGEDRFTQPTISVQSPPRTTKVTNTIAKSTLSKRAKVSTKWSNDQLCSLVKAYIKHKKNKNIGKEAAWMEISKEMSKANHFVSWMECKKTWKHMKNAFYSQTYHNDINTSLLQCHLKSALGVTENQTNEAPIWFQAYVKQSEALQNKYKELEKQDDKERDDKQAERYSQLQDLIKENNDNLRSLADAVMLLVQKIK